MPRWILRIGLLVTFALLIPAMVGCQTDRAGANTSLRSENQELRRRVHSQDMALDQLESERKALQNKLDNRSSNTPQPQPQPVSVPADQFQGIEGVQTQIQGNDLHVTVASDVLFASGKATLRESAKKTLHQVSGVLKSDYADNTIRVEGHTDTDPIKHSHWKDNLALSLARAAAVDRYLQSQGISTDRMYAAGYGATQPRETKKKSRRVEIVVTGN